MEILVESCGLDTILKQVSSEQALTTASNAALMINLLENFPIYFLAAVVIFAADDSLKMRLVVLVLWNGFTELRKFVLFIHL